MPFCVNWFAVGQAISANIAGSHSISLNCVSISSMSRRDSTVVRKYLKISPWHALSAILQKGPNLSALEPRLRKMVRLFNPRRDKWVRHFRFDDAYIVGKTPVGRATIALLKMNGADRLRIRTLLLEAGILSDETG